MKTFMELQPFIVHVAHSYADTSEEARDLIQDIAVRLWERYDTFRGNSQLRTWFYRVTLNAAMQHRRQRIRRPQTISLDPDMPLAAEDDASQQMIDELYLIIRQLSKEERAIVTLYLDDKNYEEIAAILNLSPSNVGVKLHRIRQKMKSIKDHLNL